MVARAMPGDPSAAKSAREASLLLKIVRWSVLATVGALLGLLGLLFARPEILLFYPNPVLQATPEAIDWAYERVELETEDGETLVGWYLEADRPGPLRAREWVVIYCHGNGGNIGGRIGVLEGLRALGLSVLIFDYRGYGESSGRPTVAGTRLDVATAWSHVVETRGVAPERVLLWGRSLGGAIAIDQAARASEARTPPAALVVESSFTSTVTLGKELYPWLPVGWFRNKIDYPSLDRIAEVGVPVLLAHSPDDELIPRAHGQALLEAADAGAPPATAWIELAGGHNEGHLADPAHGEAVAEALTRLTAPK